MTRINSDFITNSLSLSKFNSDAESVQSINDRLNLINAKKDAKLVEAANNFEAVFISQLLNIMDKTIERSEFMHGGQGEKVFREMFYQEIAKDIASNSNTSMGLGKQIYEQLSQYQ